jgi:beta-glucosidase
MKVFFKGLILSVFLLHIQCSEKKSLTKDRIPEIEALLSEMSLLEKIGQLNLVTPGGGIATGSVVSSDVEEKIKAGKVGGLFGISGPEKIKKAQDLAMNNSRLKIPLLFGSDVIHGYKTTYPIPLGISSSWDLNLIQELASMAAREATADGIHWNFSPMVDVSRDPRWGRISEGSGEDPFLGSKIAGAMVRGYQGNALNDHQTMVACVKHFALYGASEAGRDYNAVDMSKLKMYNEFLPPYLAAIEAGAGSVMTSFNTVDGIPASANKWLLTDLLRDDWSFDGFVVSDYTSVNEMVAHGIGDLKEVSAKAINAGLDMDMVGEGFLSTLEQSVKEGIVSEEAITKACRRILEAKYKLGLFQDPYKYIDSSRPKKDILTNENRLLARKAANKSFVLLKNELETLPLKSNQKVALVGALANNKNNMLGTWAPTGNPQLSVSILEGFNNTAPQLNISYAKGANISDDVSLAKKVNVFGPRIEIDNRTPEEMIKEAVLLAKSSDVVVAVVGEASEMSGESASRTDLNLPASQKKLINALASTGKPIVLVLMSGRPLTIPEELKTVASVLQVWFPGVEAGNAIAETVLGMSNPSGKLTATWPRNVGQIPIYHSQKITGRPQMGDEFQKFKSNYLDVENTPLLPFGYGLSYTKFTYGAPTLSRDTLSVGSDVRFTVSVTNSGRFDGEEVVQLYISDKKRSIAPPVKALKGFKKVFIEKEATQEVVFNLDRELFKFYNQDLMFVLEPGDFDLSVGTNSQNTQTLNLYVE